VDSGDPNGDILSLATLPAIFRWQAI